MELAGVIVGIAAGVFIIVFGSRGLIDFARAAAERRRNARQRVAGGDAPSDEPGVRHLSIAGMAATHVADLPVESPLSPDALASGTFVGREEEMQELTEVLERAIGGRGRLVMLVGEPGIGKTRTSMELARLAVARGAQALIGRCYESQGTPPYLPWIQAIRGYVRSHNATELQTDLGPGAVDIATMVPEVRQRLLELPLPPAVEAEQARFRLFDSVSTFFRNASRRQPLIVVLDDLHTADRPSLLLLEFLAREISTARLLVLGTYRDVEVSRRHPLYLTLAELTRENLFDRKVLRGLDQEGVRRFVEATAKTMPPSEVVDAVYAQTEGNPLFVTETVRLLDDEGIFEGQAPEAARDRRLRIPEGVREVIGRRLDRLTEACNETLTVGSVIGREFSLDELGRLFEEQTSDELLVVLEEALGARVIEELPRALGRYQFTHALIRETLADELSMTRRGRLHQRIAMAMEELYSDSLPSHLGQLAYHFFEAAQAGDPHKAADYCSRAAESAMAHVAYEEAARLYDMALQTIEGSDAVDEAQRTKLLVSIGRAQVKASDYEAATRTLERAASAARALGSSEGLAGAAIALAETRWRPGYSGEPVVPVLEEALAALPKRDSAIRALVLAGLARCLTMSERLDSARSYSDQAVEMARRLNDPPTLTLAFRTAGFLGVAGRGLGVNSFRNNRAVQDEMLELSKELGDKDTFLEVCTWRVFDLLELGDIPAMKAVMAQVEEAVKDYRVPHWVYLVALWRVIRAMLEGRFEDAESYAQDALREGMRLHAEGVEGTFGLQMFAISKDRGKLPSLEPVLKMFFEEHSDTPTWRPGLAIVYAEMNRPEEAREAFEALAADAFSGIPRDTMWIASMAMCSEVCSYLGDAARADVLYDFLLPSDGLNVTAGQGLCYGPVSLFLGLLATTSGRWEIAERHFNSALEMSDRAGSGPWCARTQLHFSNMLLTRGNPTDNGRAAGMLDESLATASALGMSALAEQARARKEAMAGV